jgi:short-subunit dehydrogenase
MSPFDFKSTTTLVTGASSGLGEEFARQIAARRGDLVLVARTQERLDAVAEELRAKHQVEITTLPADLSEPAGVGEVIHFAANQRINVLVNNAGFGTYGKFAELDPARERAEIMVNVAAPVDLAHALLPGMLASRSGGIITVASAIGFQPGPGQAVYGATKAFALSFSEALWAETRGTGIRVVVLCPGPTATGFLSGLGDERAASSSIYRRAADPAQVVQAALRGFDRDEMTIVPGARNRLLAQGYRFTPRKQMARLSGRMLAPH